MPPEQNKKSRIRFSFFLFLILFIFGFVVFREVENIYRTPIDSWTNLTSADCAVVLTGGPGRIKEGLSLLANHRISKLIISGVYPETQLRDLQPLSAVSGVISDRDVILEKRSETTYGNAQQTLPIVEALGCRDVLIVTSKTHMNRAYKTFRATYPKSIGLQSHSVMVGSNRAEMIEVYFEALKSLFYAVFAY